MYEIYHVESLNALFVWLSSGLASLDNEPASFRLSSLLHQIFLFAAPQVSIDIWSLLQILIHLCFLASWPAGLFGRQDHKILQSILSVV